MTLSLYKQYILILLILLSADVHSRFPRTYYVSQPTVTTYTEPLAPAKAAEDCCPQPIPLCCPKQTYKPIIFTPRVRKPKPRCYKPQCQTTCASYTSCHSPRNAWRRPTLAAQACCQPRTIYCRPQPVCCPPKPVYCREKPACCPKVRCCRPKPPCCPRPLPPCPKPACIQPPHVQDILPPTCPPCKRDIASHAAGTKATTTKTAEPTQQIPQRSLATREISAAELQPKKVTP